MKTIKELNEHISVVEKGYEYNLLVDGEDKGRISYIPSMQKGGFYIIDMLNEKGHWKNHILMDSNGKLITRSYGYLTDFDGELGLAGEGFCEVDYIVKNDGSEIRLPGFGDSTTSSFNKGGTILRWSEKGRKGYYFLVDKKGEIVSKKYQWMGGWDKEFFQARDEKGMIYVGLDGKETSKYYDKTGDFHNGIARVEKDGKKFFVDISFNEIFKGFNNIHNLSGDYFNLFDGENWYLGTIKDGKIAGPFERYLEIYEERNE